MPGSPTTPLRYGFRQGVNEVAKTKKKTWGDTDYYLRNGADYDRFDLNTAQRKRKHRREKLRRRSLEMWLDGGEMHERKKRGSKPALSV